MTDSVSNDTGRALEYKIIEEFIEHCNANKVPFELSARTEDKRDKDERYFAVLQSAKVI